jgi:hypothetical protein
MAAAAASTSSAAATAPPRRVRGAASAATTLRALGAQALFPSSARAPTAYAGRAPAPFGGAPSVRPPAAAARRAASCRPPAAAAMAAEDEELEATIPQLEGQLAAAVAAEDFQRAARLRDAISLRQSEARTGVEDANRRFYDAFRSGDAGRMAEMWGRGEHVQARLCFSCFHARPSSGRRRPPGRQPAAAAAGRLSTPAPSTAHRPPAAT